MSQKERKKLIAEEKMKEKTKEKAVAEEKAHEMTTVEKKTKFDVKMMKKIAAERRNKGRFDVKMKKTAAEGKAIKKANSI
jgi:hypothetical protein